MAIGRRSGPGGHKLAAASATILIAAVFGITAVYMGIMPRGDTRTDETAALTSGSDASGLDVDAAAPEVLDAEADLAPLAANAALIVEEPGVLQEQPVELEQAPVEQRPVEVEQSLVERPPAELVEPPADVVETTLEQIPADVAEPLVEQPPIEFEQPDVPEPLAEPVPVVDSGSPPRVPSPGDGSVVEPATTVQRNSWVCEGSLSFADPTNQRWSVSRVSFLPGKGYERVVLYMDRVGLDRGDPASVTAETFPSSRLREQFPNVARPSLGKNTVVLNLADGVTSTLGLRGYKPKGLVTLREFSVSQSPDGSSKLTIGVAGDGCFRLRAPVWNDATEGRTVRQIQLDVKD